MYIAETPFKLSRKMKFFFLVFPFLQSSLLLRKYLETLTVLCKTQVESIRLLVYECKTNESRKYKWGKLIISYPWYQYPHHFELHHIFMLLLAPIKRFIMPLVLMLLFEITCIALGARDLKQIHKYDYSRHSKE